MVRSDRRLFRLLGDDVCRDLLERLLGREGPQTQAQLTKALELSSSTVSRRIGRLEEEGIVEQAGKRGPYHVTFPTVTRKLLDEASELAKLIAAEHYENASEHRSQQRREALAGGHMHDRTLEGGA